MILFGVIPFLIGSPKKLIACSCLLFDVGNNNFPILHKKKKQEDRYFFLST